MHAVHPRPNPVQADTASRRRQGPAGLCLCRRREAARRVGRDIKVVHGDVTALLDAGVLERAEGGGIVFPYQAAKVAFLLQAA